MSRRVVVHESDIGPTHKDDVYRATVVATVYLDIEVDLPEDGLNPYTEINKAAAVALGLDAHGCDPSGHHVQLSTLLLRRVDPADDPKDV